MPDYTLIETTVSDKADVLLPLLQAHREELATHKELMQLAPNWDAYRALENTRSLLAVLAYRGDELVGYAVSFIGAHLHYSGLRYCQSDALFIVQAHRKGSLGLRLMRETERLAKERGARMMMWHASPGTSLERLMQHAGNGMQEIIFSKEL